MEPVDGIFFGVTELIVGASYRCFNDDFATTMFKESTKEVLSCKYALGRPMNEESESHRVDSSAVLPRRLADDRSEGERPNAGTITVVQPETGQNVPNGLKPIPIPSFAILNETDASSCNTATSIDILICLAKDKPEAVRIKTCESDTH
jgi:hypothetical protein